MTLLSDIISRSFRLGNLIPIGTSPSTAEAAEGLSHLQSLILSTLGNEAGEKLSQLPIGSNNVTTEWVPSVPDFLPLNARLVCNLEAAQTVYLHPSPQDGSRLAIIDASGNFATNNLTLNGNGSLIDGAATATLNTNSQAAQYFFRADLGDWVEIGALASSDAMPFPAEFDLMFIVLLAMVLGPANSQPIAAESMNLMERSREQFRARYSQIINTPSDIGVLALTQRRQSGNILNGWQ